jgi:monoamine oxidase
MVRVRFPVEEGGDVRVVVIGGGLAGLTAADELRRAGSDVEVFEASERVGGRVWSVPFADLGIVERGAEFVLPGADELVGVASRFGLELRRKGMRYGSREPRGGEPTTVAELVDAIQSLDGRLPANATVAAALRDHGVRPAVAEALRSRVEISCTYTAEDLCADELVGVASHFGDFDTHTVHGGNMRIAECLATALDRAVHLRAPVTRVAQTDGGVRVSAPGGEVEADAAVIAVPARVMDEIAFDPPLGPSKQTATLRYGHAAKLFVRLEEAVPPSATQSVPGRFWCYTQLDRDGAPLPILGALAGSEQALAALEVDSGPERWLDAIEQLRPELRLDRSTTMLCSWHDQPWIRALQVARSLARPIDDEALASPVGRLSFAGEHTAGPVWHGTMEGAIRSGRRAAGEVLAAARLAPT